MRLLSFFFFSISHEMKTLKEKKFPGRMDTAFDVIPDEEEVLRGLKASGKRGNCLFLYGVPGVPNH